MIILLIVLAIYALINLVAFEVLVRPDLSIKQRQEWSTTPFRSALVICTITLPAALASLIGGSR